MSVKSFVLAVAATSLAPCVGAGIYLILIGY